MPLAWCQGTRPLRCGIRVPWDPGLWIAPGSPCSVVGGVEVVWRLDRWVVDGLFFWYIWYSGWCAHPFKAVQVAQKLPVYGWAWHLQNVFGVPTVWAFLHRFIVGLCLIAQLAIPLPYSGHRPIIHSAVMHFASIFKVSFIHFAPDASTYVDIEPTFDVRVYVPPRSALCP